LYRRPDARQPYRSGIPEPDSRLQSTSAIYHELNSPIDCMRISQWDHPNLDLPAIAEVQFPRNVCVESPMFENLQFLPMWITRAGIPALSVMGFFWKGDEALSGDFKQWLSQKIMGVKLTVPNIAGIEPLGRIFDFIYGRQYFALTTFARVSAISFVAIVVANLIFARGAVSQIAWNLAHTNASVLAQLLIINILFDYVSITKSRLLIKGITRLNIRGRDVLFVVSDLIISCLIVAVYTIISMMYDTFDEQMERLWPYNFAFMLTSFLTLLLTILYSLSLLSLSVFGAIAKATRLLQWMLPVRELPVRSIGIVAGVLLFCFLEIFHALAD
jgi:hypothetical protein